MQFESFHWLSHHGLWAIIPCSINMESVCMSSWTFLLLFKSSFLYFGGHFQQNNYFTRARWIWNDYSQLGATCLVGYLSSHIRARGIIVNYIHSLMSEWCVIQTKTKWPAKTCVSPVFLKEKSWEDKILYQKIQKSLQSFEFSIFISSEMKTEFNCSFEQC